MTYSYTMYYKMCYVLKLHRMCLFYITLVCFVLYTEYILSIPLNNQ